LTQLQRYDPRAEAARRVGCATKGRRERTPANVTPRRWCSAEALQRRTSAGRRHLPPTVRQLGFNLSGHTRKYELAPTPSVLPELQPYQLRKMLLTRKTPWVRTCELQVDSTFPPVVTELITRIERRA
jgi:hypothetical protein